MNIFNPSNIEKWELGDTEIGKICISPRVYANSNLQLNIPKLMPLIPLGRPKVTNISLSNSCYANANNIAISRTIGTQNFITVSHQANRSFSNEYLSYGDTVLVEVHNKNPDTIFLSTKIDSSYNLYD